MCCSDDKSMARGLRFDPNGTKPSQGSPYHTTPPRLAIPISRFLFSIVLRIHSYLARNATPAPPRDGWMASHLHLSRYHDDWISIPFALFATGPKTSGGLMRVM